MFKPNSAVWLLTGLAAAALLVPGTAIAADQTIEDFEVAQQAAWNAHDAGAYTATFDANAQIVTALGWRWNGQAEAARNIGDGFKFVYAKAQLRLADVQVRMLTPELASVILSWTIDGARPINAELKAGVQSGVEIQLLQRRGAGWLVLTQQDTGVSQSVAAVAPLPATAQSPAQTSEPAATFPLTPPPVRRCIMARGNGTCLIYGKAK